MNQVFINYFCSQKKIYFAYKHGKLTSLFISNDHNTQDNISTSSTSGISFLSPPAYSSPSPSSSFWSSSFNTNLTHSYKVTSYHGKTFPDIGWHLIKSRTHFPVVWMMVCMPCQEQDQSPGRKQCALMHPSLGKLPKILPIMNGIKDYEKVVKHFCSV